MTTSSLMVLSVLATAVVSSVLTVALVVVCARWFLRRRLAREVDEAAEILARRVQAVIEEASEPILVKLRTGVAEGLEEAGEALLPRIRGEVAAGVREGADAALPRVRAEVSEGFREALTSALGPRALGKAGEELVRRGSSVIDAGLGLIFGSDSEDE